jgi:replicative DNA helicase|tara:strand:- start:891 stop:2180 length:1290 start_codon:yes stop_codon:yes gene_type:complete
MHDSVVEGSALSSIINDPSQGFRAVAVHGINRDSFVDEFCGLAFEVVETMLSQGQPLTQQSIWSRIVALDSNYSVSRLEQIYVYNESRPLYWCDLLRKYKLAREAIKLTSKAEKEMANPFNVEECISSITEDLFQLLSSNKVEESDDITMDDLILRGGYPSKYDSINKVITKYPPSFPVVIGARPGVGKTTWLCNEKLNHIIKRKNDWWEFKKNRHATMFSLEMPRADILRKCICILSGIEERKVKADKLDKNEHKTFKAYLDLLKKAPLTIYDKSMTPKQISSAMRYASERYNTTFFGLDYVQRMKAFSGRSKDREFYARASNDIADTLKSLPTNPMMIILSQLSREADINKHESVNERKKKSPRLSHFKETGALEEDAYLAGLLYPDPEHIHMNLPKQPIIMSWEKNRGGSTGSVKMVFHKKTQTFS